MKALVVFDSNYGNTKIIAKTIAEVLGKESKLISVEDFSNTDLNGVNLLVAGSPIVGWKPTEKMIMFLSKLKSEEMTGKKAAAFDTRINIFFHGDAAGKIAHKLSMLGAEIVGEPKGFFVKDKEGPITEGEIEKAKEWAKSLKKD